MRIPFFKRKSFTKLDDLKQKGFDLQIKEIGSTHIAADNEGYILASDDMYKKIVRVYPINSDFLDDGDLEFVTQKIQNGIKSLKRFGIYIQKEPINYSDFLLNLERVRDAQDNIITQTKQAGLIDYVYQKKQKLKNISSFYIVLENRELEELGILVKQLMLSLAETHIDTKVLSANEIYQVIEKRLFDINAPLRNCHDINQVLPDNIINYQGLYQQLDNQFHRQLVINSYPDSVPNYLWLKDLFRLDESINIALISTLREAVDITPQLDRTLSALHQRRNDLYKESEILENENQIESSKAILKELSSKQTTVFDVCVVIDINGESLDDLKIKVRRIKSLMASLSIGTFEPLRKGFIPLISTLPILANNVVTQKYTWNLLSSDIASLIIFDSSEFFRADGIPIGKHPDSDVLFAFDPFSEKDFYNPHMLIIGLTGSGKTFFILYLCERLMAYADYIIKLDIAGVLGKGNTNRFIFSTDGTVTINPFYIRLPNSLDEVDQAGLVTEKVLDLLHFFQEIANFTDFELPVLENLIRNTLEYKGISSTKDLRQAKEATFSDFKYIITLKKEYLKNLLDKAEKLEKDNLIKQYNVYEKILNYIEPFVEGSYSKLFNGFNNFEYHPGDTTLDFSKLPAILRAPVYNIVLQDLWRFCTKDGTRESNPNVPKKVIVADEEHEFIDQPETLKFISSKFIKQGRKYKVLIINATQNIVELEQNKQSEAILSNCNFKFLLKLGDTDYAKAQKYYSLKEKEMQLIRGNKLSAGKKNAADKGKGILIIDSLHLPFKSEATLEEIKIIDPEYYRELTT